MNATDRRASRPPTGSAGRMAVLVGCGCCLIAVVIASVSSVTSSATRDHGSPAVDTAGKEQRIVSGSEIDSVCRGQNWGHESKECLAAILSRAQSGRQRPVRIIADGGGASKAQ